MDATIGGCMFVSVYSLTKILIWPGRTRFQDFFSVVSFFIVLTTSSTNTKKAHVANPR